MRLGSVRTSMRWMLALSPGASLPRMGSMVVARPRLVHAWWRGAPFFPGGEVQKNAGVIRAGGGRLRGGPLRERSLYGELFGCIVYN